MTSFEKSKSAILASKSLYEIGELPLATQAKLPVMARRIWCRDSPEVAYV